MAQIIKIAITGGPCAGKTTAVKFLADKLKKYGIGVYTVKNRQQNLCLKEKLLKIWVFLNFINCCLKEVLPMKFRQKNVPKTIITKKPSFCSTEDCLTAEHI